jgi:hypothetical protein
MKYRDRLHKETVLGTIMPSNYKVPPETNYPPIILSSTPFSTFTGRANPGLEIILRKDR